MDWTLKKLGLKSEEKKDNTPVTSPVKPSSQASVPSVDASLLPDIPLNESLITGQLLTHAQVVVSLMDEHKQLQVKVPKALMVLVKKGSFEYEIQLYTAERMVLCQLLTSNLPFWFDTASSSIIWTMEVGTTMHAFHVYFLNKQDEMSMKSLWQIAILEHGRQEDFAKAVNAKDTEWIHRANDADFMSDEDDEDRQPDDAMDFSTTNAPNTRGKFEDESDSEVEEKYNSKETKSSRQSMSDKNTSLAVGMQLNRTFVGRGAQVGVFKHDAEGSLQYLTRIPIVKTAAGEAFEPSQMMLHQQDNRLLLLNPERNNQIFEMDLERGKIVAEYGVDDDFAIRSIGPTSKYAERTTESIIMGVNKNSVFSLDPRISGKNKLAQKQVYAQAPKNTCVATSGSGDVAVGSEKGEIRLYNDIGKKAKSLLPGLGDAIIGLDVTEDGSYILATTAHYLLVIPTAMDGQTKSGFSMSMSSRAKPPIKLQLDPSDLVKYNIKSVNFTAAHFNTGDNVREEWIVTSTGKFIITWNFRKVKQNKRFEYKIKMCPTEVVADQFLFGQQDQVVVTLPDNVYLEKRAITKK